MQPDCLVVGAQHHLGQALQDPRRAPLVAPGTQGGVGDPAHEALGIDPAAPGDQADQHGPQADPIGHPRPMALERVGRDRFGEQWLDRGKDSIEHFGLERAHDDGDLHWVVGWERTRHPSWASTATGGWSPLSPYPRGF